MNWIGNVSIRIHSQWIHKRIIIEQLDRDGKGHKVVVGCTNLLVKQLGDLGWGVLGVDQTLENDDSLARGPMGTTNLTVATLGDPLALGELCEVVVMGHGWSRSHGCDHVEDRGQEIVSIDPFRTVGCLRRDGR